MTKLMIVAVITLGVVILVVGCAYYFHVVAGPMYADPVNKSKFNESIKFKRGEPINFPLFTLIYLGSEPGEEYLEGLRMGDMHQFEVVGKRDGSRQIVKWSTGTGDISPTRFSVRGEDYLLILMQTEEGTNLKDNELVIKPVK